MLTKQLSYYPVRECHRGMTGWLRQRPLRDTHVTLQTTEIRSINFLEIKTKRFCINYACIYIYIYIHLYCHHHHYHHHHHHHYALNTWYRAIISQWLTENEQRNKEKLHVTTITNPKLWGQIDGLQQERRNSIANAQELRLSCPNPSKYWLILSYKELGKHLSFEPTP